MGVLKFTGSQWLRFQTLASGLANTSDGAWTCAVLFKRVVDDAASHGLTYLLTTTPTAQAGVSLDGTDEIVGDLTAATGNLAGNPGLACTGTTETYIAVVSKGAGTGVLTYRRYVRSTTTWSSETTSGTRADGSAAGYLEVGTWQGGNDLADAWIGLVGWWEGQMSQAQAESLDDNWRTSDWWNNGLGQPTALIEMNVATGSLVDLASNASNLSVTGTLTVDSGETLDSWNFNGTGGGGGGPTPVLVVPPIRRVF